MSSNGITYSFTVFFTKLSILLLYLRLFSVSRQLRTGIHVGIAIMALFYTAMIAVAIVSVVECVGMATMTLQFCGIVSGPVQILNSTFNVVTDFWILVLPMPMISKLQMPKSRKLGLTVVFAVAFA